MATVNDDSAIKAVEKTTVKNLTSCQHSKQCKLCTSASLYHIPDDKGTNLLTVQSKEKLLSLITLGIAMYRLHEIIQIL